MATIAQQPRPLPGRGHRLAVLWLTTTIVVLAAVLVLVMSLTGADTEDRGGTAIPEQAAPGHRPGSGPELGTSNIARAPSAGPIRRDGGPEKGTRGPTTFSRSG